MALSSGNPWKDSTLSNLWDAAKTAMGEASQALPTRGLQANQPWISEQTLRLIDLRRAARAENDHQNEHHLHKEVRK